MTIVALGGGNTMQVDAVVEPVLERGRHLRRHPRE